jgi:hypothetical protein
METYITIVIALGGIATGIGAIWTAMLTRRQLGEQRRLLQEDAVIARRQAELMEQSLMQQRESLEAENQRARVGLEVDVTYKLWEQWESPTYQGYRRDGTQYVIDHFLVNGKLQDVTHVDSASRLMFDFFEHIGYLTKSGVLSIERVTNTFARELQFGWPLFESAIKALREESSTPYRYAHCEDLYHRALEYDRSRGGTGEPLTKAELERILTSVRHSDSEPPAEPSRTYDDRE